MGLDNPLHIAFLVIVLFLIFGARRIPEMARALGSGMSEFRAGLHSGVASSPSSPAAPATVPVAAPAPVAAAPTGGAPSAAPPEPNR